MVNAHQGAHPLTLEEAAQQMKDAWARENQRKVNTWNIQTQQDLAEQGEQNRIARKAEEVLRFRQIMDRIAPF